MTSSVTGSLILSMRCWPTGNPKDCSSESSLKVNMRVSLETDSFAMSVEFFHARGFKNIGPPVSGASSVALLRAIRSAWDKEPM